MTAAVLYDATFKSPFTHRVEIALREKGVPYSVRSVDFKAKGDEFESLYRSILTPLDGVARVPVLVDGPVKLAESLVIVDHLDRAHPQSPLLPADAATAAGARLFADFAAKQLPGALFGVLRADSEPAVAAAQKQLEEVLKVLDELLRTHGSAGGDFFAGEQFGLPEVAAVPILQRTLVALPAHRGIDVWQLIGDAGLDRLERWLRAALARPSVADTKPSDAAIIAVLEGFVSPLKPAVSAAAAAAAATA